MAATWGTIASLTRIADILGVPASSFQDEAMPGDLSRCAELLRLWEAIPDDAGRDRLLTLARALAAKPVAPDKRAAQ